MGLDDDLAVNEDLLSLIRMKRLTRKCSQCVSKKHQRTFESSLTLT